MPIEPLRLATYVLWGVIAFLAILLLGDYIGHKLGRRKLAMICGLIALGVVVAFAITAAVLLIGK